MAAKKVFNGPGEWNGQQIKEMNYQHLCNTVKLLESKAKELAEAAKSDEVVQLGTKYSEEWTENLREEYWGLLKEKELRESEGRQYEDLPNF